MLTLLVTGAPGACFGPDYGSWDPWTHKASVRHNGLTEEVEAMLSRLFERWRGAGPDPAFSELLEPRDGRPLIRLGGITKTFQDGDVATRALDDISLDIEKGDFVCVAGPSGCGKSTLLHTLGLLESPTQGRYELNGQPVTQFKAAALAWIRNRAVGFIFQNFNLIGDLTVQENVETPLSYLKIPAAERRERTADILARLEIERFARRYPSQLTGGEQQRVAVARALVTRPLIVMADEPTGNLDSNNGEVVMGLLEEIHREGGTLFLVTHNPEYAHRAHRTVHMFDGRIIDPENPPEGYSN